MSSDKKRAFRRDMLIASVLIVAGFGVSIVSVAQLRAADPRMAQATQVVRLRLQIAAPRLHHHRAAFCAHSKIDQAALPFVQGAADGVAVS